MKKNLNKIIIGLVLGSALAGVGTAGVKNLKKNDLAAKGEKIVKKTSKNIFSRFGRFWKKGFREMKKSIFHKKTK